MEIQNKKTKEKFTIINHSFIYGLAFGGTYTVSNLKTKEIKTITGNKFKKEYEVLK